MKKINICIILLLALCLIFVGCRGAGGEDTTAPPTETTSAEITVEETTSESEMTACTHPDMVTLEVVPKCTENYYIESHCTLCDHTERDLMPPYGHRFADGVCEICGAADESAETTAHVHELATTENVPTCTEGAMVISSCACGYTSNEEIPPLGHEFKDGVCIRCDEKEKVSDGSQGLEYRIDGDHAVLVGIGTCTDKNIVVAKTFNNLPVTEIGAYALYDCQFIESIAIPEGVTVISNEAFYLCKNLKNVTLPSTLEYIHDWAFANCESLEGIYIPGSVKWIGQRAFSDCKKLEWITLCEGLEQIQENAFMNCAEIGFVDLPRSLKLLAAASFDGCTKLASVSYGGSTNEWSCVGKEGAEWNSEWYRGIPATKVSCTDGNVYLYNLSEADAIEAARKFWDLPANAVLYLKEKSPSNPFCYKVAYCELTYADFIGNFEVKREVFVDQRTGECTEVVYQYPEIPEIFLDVIFNREKFLYVEQTVNSAGEYSYTATEALFKDFRVHYETIFGAQSLGYYVTDIDGDSIPELIFPGMAREKYGVLFRVYEGKIYGYACLLNGLHTDATYFWSEQAGCYSGRSQVYFDGIFYKSRGLTAKDINNPNNVIYYVDGNQTTKEKYDEAESAYSNEVLQYYILDYYPVYVNPFPGG